ncbi:MAG: DUF2167 domain-containing protein [Verrucomicrobiota bacterium]|jgi:uncharacterized membrane-anchored protein
MKACLPRNSNWRKYSAIFCILPILAVFLSQSCGGDQLSLTPVMPSQELGWIVGPKKASLGTLANIEVPQGYRLTDEAGARILLERMKNPVPDGLIGILAPDSGKWWVVLTFTYVGYVKDADKESINPAAVLKAVQKQSELQNSERTEQGMASIVSVDWERPPVYDVEKHLLEWAIRAETQSSKVVNDTAMLLGRRGVLGIITVRPYQASSDSVPLQQLIENITYKEGQRYADYQSGDKIADISLSGLIVDDKHPAASRTLIASSGGSVVAWIYSVLAGCVVMGGGVLVYQKRRQRRVQSAIYASGRHPAAARLPSGNGQGSGSGSDGVKPYTEKTGSMADNRGKLRRKKVFDYSKFYTHVVMELSSRSNAGAGPMLNGRTNNHAYETSEAGANQTIASATLDLIASQKNLIEEQRRLMQQQTRLIEERRKLIEEQNALLKRQTEMIESQYSLKLE